MLALVLNTSNPVAGTPTIAGQPHQNNAYFWVMNIIEQSFGEMTDFRLSRSRLHKLIDIIFMSICGVICGADDYVGIRLWAIRNEEWLRGYIDLPNGIPSDDTFRRVFQLLDYEEFSRCFIAFSKKLNTLTSGEVISIDGKCLRGSKGAGLGKTGLYMVGAWASNNQLLLGQEKVDTKSNEITSIPKLLDLLQVKGCTITLDAMGCQKSIAEKIVSKEADYILSAKGNQPKLQEQIVRSFGSLPTESTHTTHDKGHGRIESRTCEVITDLAWIEDKEDWKDLAAIVKVTSKRHVVSEDKTSEDIRYFICNQAFSAEKMLSSIRAHWGIENRLHWQLDISFNEDHNRNRTLNAAVNFSFLNRFTLNLLKKDTTKISIKHKRHRASGDLIYLAQIIDPNLI